MAIEAWWATVRIITESQMWLIKWMHARARTHTHTHTHTHTCSPQCLHQFTFLPTQRFPFFSHSHQYILIPHSLSDNCHSNRHKVISPSVFDLHFPNNDIECLFRYLFVCLLWENVYSCSLLIFNHIRFIVSTCKH